MAPRKLKPTDKVLEPVRPNLGIEAQYRRKLQVLIEEMGRSVMWRIKACYRANEPEMALDAVPAKELQAAINDLTDQWEKRFAEAAPRMAEWHQRTAGNYSQAQLRQMLLKVGIAVNFKMTRTIRDIARASVQANVQLIRSIPAQYLGQVQGAVMRSVTAGRDLGGLTKELQRDFGVSYKRAAFIALDQNNKATSAIQKARQLEVGIDEGVWLHSHGGREPRPTHLDNHGKVFNVAEGWYDPDPRVRKRIMPGELIRCRCVWKPVIRGFS